MPLPSIEKRECRRCIMTTLADPAIEFDAEGICNHCRRYEQLLPERVFTGKAAQNALDRVVDTLKAAGTGRDYDCLIGVSGGVDSTYVAYLTRQLGLRPLAVHVDNGWNSELAVKNIERTLHKLAIDLHTEVLDWREFRDLQLSFLKASTPDMDIPADHAIAAVLWKQASRHGIKHIISGMNFATESTFVEGWAYGHWDWRYIKGLHERFGSVPLKTFPHYSIAGLAYYNFVRGIRSVSILNYVDYNKARAMEVLINEIGWKYYGGKHYESIYTRFIQGYILPVKFGIDKRYGHLSDLIRSGQMSRQDALDELARPAYDDEMLRKDKDFFMKKFGMTTAQMGEIMVAPPRSFRDYRNSQPLMHLMRRGVSVLRNAGLYPR
jgi:N-acetyl sugar amidotransferase